MTARLSRWGIGPHITLAAVLYAAGAEAVTHRWPQICRMRFVPDGVLVPIAIILLVAGVTMLAVSARALSSAYNSDRLTTSGIFAFVRNPIYSAWIVFIVPALALLSRSWPLLLTPLVGYAVFKRLIHREEEYLRQRFGEAYLNYRAEVNELVPFPRRKATHVH
ncbi:MAG: isoprenylcysteine carboxylmethyltransferase family protein [Terracidiphilus sp.]